jgi:hypothetical protein
LNQRYYFHVISDDTTVYDDGGTILSSPEAARLQAAVIAAELAHDDDRYRGFVVRVVDDRGNELAIVPVVTGIGDLQ